jgi:two-component system, chemotaxis family, response regulator PixG
MHPQATSPPVNLPKYSATRKVEFLKALKRLEFSGKLVWSDATGHDWTLFISHGRIVYATGGVHSIRRWKRHLSARYPHLKLDIKTLEYELSTATSFVLPNCWEYQILYAWTNQQKIVPHDAAQIIQDIVVEILFDIAQAPGVTYQIGRCPSLTAEFTPIEVDDEAVFTAAQKLWYAWSEANLGGYFPNFAPKIQDLDQIRAATSPQTYRTLTALLTGQHTLWDLAVKTQRSILQLTQALNPYIQMGWIALAELAEEAVPTALPRPPRSPAPVSASPLIACVDDSLMVCQSMKQVIEGAGYRFVGVMEASRAIATLLARKPDVIFLDLIMPETNGYDICSYLRKLSVFKQTPIIILSGTDGVVDQVRARLLGASDFLSKPVEPNVILTIIRKHLGAAALP